MSIFRHERPLSEVPAPEPETNRVGATPDLPYLSQVHHAEKPLPRRKPYLAFPEVAQGKIAWLTGAALKAFVATIRDDADICFIDVPEGKEPHLVHLSAGDAIVGK